MKRYKIVSIIILCLTLLFGATSCAVVIPVGHKNHRGWNKNQNNPHYHQSTRPDKSQGRHRK